MKSDRQTFVRYELKLKKANDLNITIECDVLYNYLVEHTFAEIIRKFVGTISE